MRRLGEDDVVGVAAGRQRRRTSGRSRSRRRRRCRRTRRASRRRSTWFQPMCGSVGASSRRTVRPGSTPSVVGAVLVAALEQELQPEADAEERPVGGDPGADRLDEAAPRAAGPSPAPRRRRPGTTSASAPSRSPARSRRRTRRPTRGQRLLDADEVAGAVVDDRDPRALGAAVIRASPSSRRRRVRRGSGSQATRSARPSALNAASARWWSLRPVPRQVERRAGGPGERLEGVLDELERQPADPLAAERQVDDRVRPAADVDRRRVASDSSIGTLLSPKRRIPARSPSASANAAPSTSATSSTVWCSSTSRSPVARISRSNRPWWRERAEQVVVEADRRSRSASARAVEVERRS